MESSTLKWCINVATVCIITVFFWNPVSSTNSSQTLAEAFKAIRGNMTSRLQDWYKIPPRYYTTPIPIYLSYEPLQIIKVDEIYQTIIVSGTVTMWWRDPNIGWNPKDFNGVEAIQMPSELFWTPTILVPKTTVTEVISLHMPEYIYVSHVGFAKAFIPAYTNTLCNLDMSAFPFDTHNCTIVFLENDFYNLTSQILPYNNISKHFGTNAAWILLEYGCNQVKTHNVDPPFEYIICYVKMRRRSTFFVVNLIGPMAMTSLMTLIVFWIPAEEGEKITFLVSMFMSTSVFLNYILDLIPRSMENIPRLNLLLYAIVLQVILATAATAYVLRRYKQEQQGQHHQPKQKQDEQQHSSMWLWPRQRQGEQRTQDQKDKNSQRRAAQNKHQVSLHRRNVVYPKTQVSERTNNSDNENYNNQALYISAVTEKGEKGNIPVPEVFTVDGDVPRPPEYTPPQDDGSRSQSGRRRCMTHDELDRLFFFLMLLLTIAVYLCAFLV